MVAVAPSVVNKQVVARSRATKKSNNLVAPFPSSALYRGQCARRSFYTSTCMALPSSTPLSQVLGEVRTKHEQAAACAWACWILGSTLIPSVPTYRAGAPRAEVSSTRECAYEVARLIKSTKPGGVQEQMSQVKGSAPESPHAATPSIALRKLAASDG